MAVIIAQLLNSLMPSSWRPPRWMWQYDFVRRKRGTRRCAQCNNRGEPTELLYPFTSLQGKQMTEGRTFPLATAKRPPFLCEFCLKGLQKQGLTTLVLSADRTAHFMHEGKMSDQIKVGPGLKRWLGLTD